MASNRLPQIAGIMKRAVWWPLAPLLAVFLASVLWLYQSPASYTIDVGGPGDEAYTLNFHGRLADSQPTYRWSDVYGYVTMPGIGGSRPFTLTLSIDPGRTAPVEVFVNGEQFYSDTLDAGWHDLVFRVDSAHPQALVSRDMVIEFRSTDYRTEDNAAEPKGIKVDKVSVQQDSAGAFIVPAIAPVIWMCVSLVLAFWLVRWWMSAFASEQRSRLYGLIAALLLAIASLIVLAQNRIFVGASAGHLAATLVSALLISLAVEWLLRWRRVDLTPYLSRALSAVIALAFALRFGGMGLPQSVIVDMPYHMKWLRQLLTGDWQSLYFPGGLSAVPREWGMELLIPKSPLFYAIFAPLDILPFDLATSTKWLVCLMDASVALGSFWLARKAGLSQKASVFSAFLYAIMPLAFRAFAYGILPTIFAQWLVMLLFVLIVALSENPSRIFLWLLTGLVAVLTLLAFPTIAVFVTLVIGAYLLWLWLRPALVVRSARAYLWRVPLTIAIAWVLAIVAYYGLYISPIMASVGALLAPTTAQTSTVKWPGGVADLLDWTADYVVTLLPALLALAGFFLFRGRTADSRRTIVLLICWAAIAPLFLVANYKFDMIGKHLFFVMLPVAVAGGAAIWGYARRGRWATVLASLALSLVAWQGLVFWVERLVRQSS